MLENVLEGVLTENQKIVVLCGAKRQSRAVAHETVGTHLQLVGTLLTADIQDFLLCQTEHGLQGEGGFSDTGLTAQENDAAWHQTTSEHTVQLVVVHVDTGIVVVGDLV